MGHSKKAKAKSHDRVVRVAATRFRKAGVDGVGVAGLMKDAGLTHGGFYRHFASRDELVAEAVERALRDGGDWQKQSLARSRQQSQDQRVPQQGPAGNLSCTRSWTAISVQLTVTI